MLCNTFRPVQTLQSRNIAAWAIFFVYFAEFEIIYPTVFHHSTGPIASSDFTSQHRKKRSALWDSDRISINISTLSDHYQVSLKPNKQLLSPGFRVYHRHHGNRDHVTINHDVINAYDSQECHFHGVIESHNNSKAALSLCSGVVSIILLFPSFFFGKLISKAFYKRLIVKKNSKFH